MAQVKRRLTFDYNEFGDILDVFDGKPYDTINVDATDRLILRLDPKTHRVVGFMVTHLSSLVEVPLTPEVVQAVAIILWSQVEPVVNKLTADRPVVDVQTALAKALAS